MVEEPAYQRRRRERAANLEQRERENALAGIRRYNANWRAIQGLAAAVAAGSVVAGIIGSVGLDEKGATELNLDRLWFAAIAFALSAGAVLSINYAIKLERTS